MAPDGLNRRTFLRAQGGTVVPAPHVRPGARNRDGRRRAAVRRIRRHGRRRRRRSRDHLEPHRSRGTPGRRVLDDRIVPGCQPGRRARRARGHGLHRPRRSLRVAARASAFSIASRSRACRPACWSEPIAGTFTTPPADARHATSPSPGRPTPSVKAGASTPTLGGMRLYEAMRQAGADVFIHTGDTIYADAPLAGRRSNWTTGACGGTW